MFRKAKAPDARSPLVNYSWVSCGGIDDTSMVDRGRVVSGASKVLSPRMHHRSVAHLVVHIEYLGRDRGYIESSG